MNYPKGLDESGIMFFFRVVGVFFLSKLYSEFVQTLGREKKYLGEIFGAIWTNQTCRCYVKFT